MIIILYSLWNTTDNIYTHLKNRESECRTFLYVYYNIKRYNTIGDTENLQKSKCNLIKQIKIMGILAWIFFIGLCLVGGLPVLDEKTGKIIYRPFYYGVWLTGLIMVIGSLICYFLL